ncbi:MAG: helix-turn-helix domain-containing protein [Treponemataceae bacterium]
MDETKEKILAAALDLFSTDSYAAVPTKTIAQLAAVNEVTLFRLFSSKRNLYLEVFRRFFVVPTESFLFGGLRGDLPSDIRLLGRTIASLFIGNHKVVRMSLKEMENFPEIKDELRRHPVVLISLVSTYFRRVAAEDSWADDPDRLAEVFVTSLMGTVIHLQRFKPAAAVLAFVDDFTTVLFRGMRVPTA